MLRNKILSSWNHCLLLIFSVSIISLFSCGGGGGDGGGNAPPPSTTSFQIKPYLQYRSFEDSSLDRYQSWIEITKQGEPIEQLDVKNIKITDSTNSILNPTFSEFVQYAFIIYDCSTSTCIDSGLTQGSGFWALYDYIHKDTYQAEVTIAEDEIITSEVSYDGQVTLPTVSSSSMQYQWLNGDLVLSWMNPTDDVNWEIVDNLRIVIFDDDQIDILHTIVNRESNTVTIPASVISEAIELGGEQLVRWQIQTRAYDSNDMNCARGYSDTIAITYAINSSYLQYRNYTNPDNDRYAAWIGISKGGMPTEATDFFSFQLKDPNGQYIAPQFAQFFVSSPYLYYDCSSSPCTLTFDNVDSGYWASYEQLIPGDYQFKVTAKDGHEILSNINYPGKLELPVISTTNSSAEYKDGDLILNWINPTSDSEWNKVDQLRIVLFADDDSEVLYIRTNSNVETITIPKDIISEVENLGRGNISYWQIQTRANDVNGMNYARGYSW